jgi:hypothetical protein
MPSVIDCTGRREAPWHNAGNPARNLPSALHDADGDGLVDRRDANDLLLFLFGGQEPWLCSIDRRKDTVQPSGEVMVIAQREYEPTTRCL